MRKSHKAVIALVVLLSIPLFINLSGWNLYSYIKLKESDVVLASAVGSCHLAISERYEPSGTYDLLHLEFEDLKKEILQLGPLEIFAERRSTHFQFCSFNVMLPDEHFRYTGIEFPWFLFYLLPYVIWSRFSRPMTEKASKSIPL